MMKIATTAAIASSLLHPALCSNLRRKDVGVSNKSFSSVEGTLLKTLRHPSISPLHSKLLRDEPATMPAPDSDEVPCLTEATALLECQGVPEAVQCLIDITTELAEDTTCEQLKSDPDFCPKISSCFGGGIDEECIAPKLQALEACAEENYPEESSDEEMCDDLCTEPEEPGFMQTSEKKYDGHTKSTIKDKCNNPSNCKDCKKDCPSKYEKGCKKWKDCDNEDDDDDSGKKSSKKYDGHTKSTIKDKCNNPSSCRDCEKDCPSKYEKGCKKWKDCDSEDDDDDSGNRSSKKYDGFTEKEIKDKCNNPKNCSACKKDCPNKYKKGCKEWKKCGGEDLVAFA